LLCRSSVGQNTASAMTRKMENLMNVTYSGKLLEVNHPEAFANLNLSLAGVSHREAYPADKSAYYNVHHPAIRRSRSGSVLSEIPCCI
jgi:hypothetical protein